MTEKPALDKQKMRFETKRNKALKWLKVRR